MKNISILPNLSEKLNENTFQVRFNLFFFLKNFSFIIKVMVTGTTF